MANRVRYKTYDQITMADMMVFSKLPTHPFWGRVEEKIDFSFADKLCSVLYSGRGQYPYAPSLKLKIHLVQTYYNLSDRQVEEKVIGDLFIKKFLGLPVDFIGFDHSTIGLDRNRMGSAMFHACHLYILAQMYSLGLWGDKDEQWIIDSFPTNIAVARTGAYRLIQQSMIQIVQHLKRNHLDLYKITCESVATDAMMFRLPHSSSTNEQILGFSKLVAQAYGLLQWFQNERVAPFILDWPSNKGKQKFDKLQAVLRKILEENSQVSKHDDNHDSESHNNQDSDQLPVIEYEKIPHQKRPSNRIISTTDPEARISKKGNTTIKGYKTQNLCTTGDVILDTKIVPATEHDRDAMFGMIQGIHSFFGIQPSAILGDTAYGHGKQRKALATLNIPVVAPIPITPNPTGLFDNTVFHYNSENDVFTCPNDKSTYRKNYNRKINGKQYFFAKKDCQGCPMKAECTTNKNGRSVFRSDYHDYYEIAKIYNESEEGKEDHKQRFIVERKNKELKNDCGLGAVKTKSKQSLAIKSKLSAMVVNLKLTVRELFAPNPGFIRRSKTT